jgi:hypothetical protein
VGIAEFSELGKFSTCGALLFFRHCDATGISHCRGHGSEILLIGGS